MSQGSSQRRVFRNNNSHVVILQSNTVQCLCFCFLLLFLKPVLVIFPELLGEALCFPMMEPLDADLLKDRPGQSANLRRKRCRCSRFPLQLPNPHEFRQFGLANADGQMRCRTITLAAVNALGEASLKCCITTGSVRTLVR